MTDPAPLESAAGARRLLSLLAPFIGLAVVVLFFTVMEPDSFPTFYNFKNVATQTVIVGLGAVGMTFVIVSGGIDLSIGSVIAFSSVVSAWCMLQGFGAAAAALAGVLAGALCGALNGLLITRLKVVPFIITLGMLGIARGAAKALAGEQKIDADASWLAGLMTKPADWDLPVLPLGVWLMLGLAGVMAFVLRKTIFGTRTFAVGSSEATARLCGVPVEGTKVAIYALCGAFAGLAGVLQFGRLTVGDPTTALGKELDIIAAVVIGGASLSGGTGSILGALIGAFLMSFLANGCNLMGVPNYAQEILIGVIIVLAVTIDQLRSRRG
jgi:ribose transport system permease protein